MFLKNHDSCLKVHQPMFIENQESKLPWFTLSYFMNQFFCWSVISWCCLFLPSSTFHLLPALLLDFLWSISLENHFHIAWESPWSVISWCCLFHPSVSPFIYWLLCFWTSCDLNFLKIMYHISCIMLLDNHAGLW